MSLIPFGARGLKIRLWSASVAGLFALAVVGSEALARLNRGALIIGWALFALVAAVLFYRVARTDDEGELEASFLNALLPWPVWTLLLLVVFSTDGEVPPFGHYRLLGSDWTGSGLYLVFACSVFVYNLARLNLQRLLGGRR